MCKLEAYKNCSRPLGIETSAVHDEFMTSSSYYFNSPPYNARLNMDLGSLYNPSSWSPKTDDKNPWLQIDFRSNRTRVTAIATQGSGDEVADGWVTRYALSYAEYQDYIFTYYKQNNLKKVNMMIKCE